MSAPGQVGLKTCARYSLTLSSQEEQVLGLCQPVKAGKLESQEKIVTAFFADSKAVMQHQTDSLKAGLAAHASIEASAYLAADFQRNLIYRLSQWSLQVP